MADGIRDIVGPGAGNEVYNLAAPGANTDILSSDVRPNDAESSFRVTVALATGSVFNVTIDDGTNSFTWGLNASAALNAADLYVFTFSVRNAYTYNFQVETDGIIQQLLVDEMTGGAI